MRIAYDCSVSSFQRKGGITRYFEELTSRLPSRWKQSFIIPESVPCTYAARKNAKIIRYRTHRFRPRRLAAKVEPFFFNVRLSLLRADILHPTFYDLVGGKSFNEVTIPIVVTVYDFIVRTYPELFVNAQHEIEKQQKAIERADAIICISKSTCDDLSKYIPSAIKRATVIPLAVNVPDQDPSAEVVSVEAPFFLFVGERDGYKNFASAVKALGIVRSRIKEVKLIVVGKLPADSDFAVISSLDLEEAVKFAGPMADEGLARLYSQSVGLIYPSVYEGFGLPLLEAMACKTAVIASNSSSMPEVAGDAAILVQPGDSEQIAAGMIKLLEDSSYRTSMIEKGIARVRLFNWERTVAETVHVYDGLVARGK